MDFRDRVIVVTGASSGIGYATALEFARRGSVVVAVARREPNLKALIDECRPHSPQSVYIAGDLGERAFAERVVDESVERFGRIDVLINNAGISKHKQIYHATAEEAEHVMRVNFLSCLWTTFAAIPHMLRRGEGWIVNVSSFVTKVAAPRESIYSASKGAMNGFTEGLWNDLEGSGIHAILVIPGAIDTEIWDKEDEPVAFDGHKDPPEIVAHAIVDAIEKRRFEITVPKRNLALMTARFLRLIFPSVLRFGLRRHEPVPKEIVERARARAERGLRLGDLSDDAEGSR